LNTVNKLDKIIISIIVCTRNEELYIGRCLDSLVNQKGINGNFEVLVIDGMSDDKTPQIIEKFSTIFNFVKHFENRAIFKPQAVNLGFKEARGMFIAICDAHTIYDSNYISTLIQVMEEHPEAQCVGGPIVSIGETDFGKATAIAMSSLFGVGNAKHRFPAYEGYAEMACFPLFRREVFDMIGYYDERFIINHDDEYCFRLNRKGGKVYLSSRAKSFYFVRNSPFKLFKQYFTYGLWQIATIKKHKIPIALRQLAPSTFFFIMLIIFVLGVILELFWIAILLPVLYIITLLTIGLVYSFNKGFLISKYIPLSIFILHFSYAIGFVWGIIKFNFGAEKFRE
jgi:glycosyltransferase involved in cell wall biosynthesis